MARKYVDLNVRAHYDEKDGVFRISSKDPQLEGEPFQVTISKNSPTMNSLVELFASKGLIVDDPFSFKSSMNSVQSPKIKKEMTSSSSRIPQNMVLPLGVLRDGSTYELNLKSFAHTLIYGKACTGKTQLLKSLAKSASEIPGVQHRIINLGASSSSRSAAVESGTEEINGGSPETYPYFDRKFVALGFEEALLTMDELMLEFHRRYEILSNQGLNHWSHTGGEMIYLFVDSAEMLLTDRSNDSASASILTDLSKLVLLGRAAGIHLFVATSNYSHLFGGHIREGFNRRIIVGSPSKEEQEDFLGNGLDYPARAFAIDRGLISNNGAKPEFFRRTH